jgi:hypothetical protein
MSPGGETLSGMGDNSETINAPRVVMEATGPRDNTSTGPPDDNNAREDTLLAENEAMSPTNDTTMETGDDVDMRPVQNEATSPMIKTSDSPGQIIVIDDDDSDMTELEEVEEEEDVEEEEEEEEEDEQHARMADQRDVNPNPVRDGSGRKGIFAKRSNIGRLISLLKQLTGLQAMQPSPCRRGTSPAMQPLPSATASVSTAPTSNRERAMYGRQRPTSSATARLYPESWMSRVRARLFPLAGADFLSSTQRWLSVPKTPALRSWSCRVIHIRPVWRYRTGAGDER